jgi:hypothetical protein
MKSISHSKTFEIAQPVSEVFPLYWVPGWYYENVMGTTDLCEDYVFLTQTHDHRSAPAIWIVKKYDPEMHFVEYYKIEPGEKIGVVGVHCIKKETKRTSIRVTYKYIALSSQAEKFVSEFSEDVYGKFIAEWHTLLTDYFNKRG